MDNPWIIHGLSMDIRESFSLPNGTPLKLRGFQPDQSRRLCGAHLSEFRDVQVFSLHFSEFRLLLILFREAPWTTKDQFGGSWGRQGSYWRYSILQWFPEIPKSWNIFWSVFARSFFHEIQGTRFGIDVRSFSKPRFIKERCFCIDLFMVWVSLG